MNARREFLFSGSAVALLAAFSSFAQPQSKVWRIGILTSRSAADPDSPSRRAFTQRMRELGYVEGKNLIIEWRSGEGVSERFASLAAELVKLKVDVIVCGSTPAASAAQKATATIPIVMAGVGDPVSTGLVKSLARPGGNITGTSSITPDLAHKQLEMLLSLRPKPARIAVLVDPDNSTHAAILKSVRAAAQPTGATILSVEARTGADIPQAIARAGREGAASILVNGALFNNHLSQIAELVLKHRLASIAALSRFPEAGGLMSYGEVRPGNTSLLYAAIFVDKIFKGAKPGDLPVEQPTRFDLVVNLKTAKALGITMPPSVMVLADRVIE